MLTWGVVYRVAFDLLHRDPKLHPQRDSTTRDTIPFDSRHILFNPRVHTSAHRNHGTYIEYKNTRASQHDKNSPRHRTPLHSGDWPQTTPPFTVTAYHHITSFLSKTALRQPIFQTTSRSLPSCSLDRAAHHTPMASGYYILRCRMTIPNVRRRRRFGRESGIRTLRRGVGVCASIR